MLVRSAVACLLISGASAFTPSTAGLQRQKDAKAIAMGGVVALSGIEFLPQGAAIASSIDHQVGSPLSLPAFSAMTSELVFLCAVVLMFQSTFLKKTFENDARVIDSDARARSAYALEKSQDAEYAGTWMHAFTDECAVSGCTFDFTADGMQCMQKQQDDGKLVWVCV
jgi:hypothetical protein